MPREATSLEKLWRLSPLRPLASCMAVRTPVKFAENSSLMSDIAFMITFSSSVTMLLAALLGVSISAEAEARGSASVELAG